MTSRRRRLLTGLPIIALAPLLVAPRGCHFGDGDVPLGSNTAGGDAGMAGDDSGGTPNTGTGGSANGGSAGAIGGAGTGGDANGGFAGGSGNGGAGGDGGASTTGACLETLSPLGDDTRGSGVTLDAVHRLLAGDHQGTLQWVGGGAADFTLALVGVDVYYVESERNPDFTLDIPVTCENHLRAIAIGRFMSSDGQLDETIPNLALNIGIPPDDGPGPAGDRIAANAVAVIDGDRMRGSYESLIPPAYCLLALQFNATLSHAGFNGSLSDHIGTVPCGVTDPDAAVALGRDTGLWHCDGDCRTTPNPVIVVEAESCEGIGNQRTHAGDEATFTRTGATLSREEFWGCGCPQYSEFVMAWTPSSPLDLRLCHDEFADTCEAGCTAELSYDLATAFQSAGASDFRFVD